MVPHEKPRHLGATMRREDGYHAGGVQPAHNVGPDRASACGLTAAAGRNGRATAQERPRQGTHPFSRLTSPFPALPFPGGTDGLNPPSSSVEFTANLIR
jgi:hypothetical protein